MLYFVVALLLLFLSFRYDFCQQRLKEKKCWFILVLIIFILLSGLRYRLGLDTTRYINRFYHDTPYLWQLKWEDFMIGEDPLYTLLNSVVFTLGGRFYIVQLLHATFVNGLLFKYIYKHSQYIFLCVFFYFIWKYTAYNMEELRASLSVVLCLFANDYILEKKWYKGLLLYAIGLFFHASTVVVILMIPLLFFFKFNKVGVLILLAAYVVGGVMMSFFEENIALLEFSEAMSDKAEGYFSRDDLTGQLHNLSYFIVNIIPFLFYPIVSLIFTKRVVKDTEMIKFEPLFLIAMLFLIVQMQIYMFYRFVNFYAVYIIIISAFLFGKLVEKRKELSYGVAYVRSLLFFGVFILAMLYPYFSDIEYARRYYPYSSVIEKSVDRQRELVYSEYNRTEMKQDEY